MRPYLLVAIFSLACTSLFAQGFNPGFEERHPYPFRAFLNKFSLNLSSGYARTFYKHDFTSFAYLRNAQNSYLINAANASPGSVSSGYSEWFSTVTPAQNLTILEDDRLVRYDSVDGVLKSKGYSIPLNLALYFNLSRLRIGGGVALDFHKANHPEPEGFLSEYEDPGKVRSTMNRYYVLLGYSAYEYYDLAFGVDLRAGKVNMGSGFDKSSIESSPFFNIGVSLEKVYSEYFRVYLRPSYEFKSYTVSLPEGGPQPDLKINDNAFQLTLGVSINYPDLPRSPIPNDKTQMKHYVSDSKGNRMLVRGQPFWKKQDPKIGELYPELQKSKRKRKLRLPFFNKKK
ncbi:hypothetical protein PZB74_17820 [Porifericola rhodea]|uniref:hypothetical protein n=1 Tax=Porifericola rhodea TaxID=930972 RepID=UPI0026656A6A|nr:hypothetical protein [Porifericola rhodea]WKN30816.1 hypothetical protein PZB74_17820 [Porifericola rhodea]